MKKIIFYLAIISIVFNSSISVNAREMSSYNNLKSVNNIFIEKMLEGGAPEEMLEDYIDEIDKIVDSYKQPIYLSEIDALFIYIFLDTMSREEFLDILVAFDLMFQEEIIYIGEHKKIPASMKNMMLVIMDDMIIVDTVLPEIKDDEDEVPTPTPLPTLEPTKEPLPFNDLEEYPWCIESVVALNENGIISGTYENEFSPERYVTKEEFYKMIVLALLDLNDMYERDFSLETVGKWYHPYMSTASYYALTANVYPNGFVEGEYITRQQMCYVAYTASLRAHLKLPDVAYSTDFEDMNKIQYYAFEPILKLQSAGIIKGVGNNLFDPNGFTTRADAAKIIYSLFILK